jgi:hypothetical protein
VSLVAPLFDGLSLTLAGDRDGHGEGDGAAAARFATGRLARGLLLRDGQCELAEEGVGFGVPILKRGLETIFPGRLAVAEGETGSERTITATFHLNLVERLAGPGSRNLSSPALYTAKNALAALHRRVPVLRAPLTGLSSALRRSFGWVTTFEEAEEGVTLTLTSTIDGARGRLRVAVDATALAADGATTVVVMNEQGAGAFDRYRDASGGALRGAAIGTWDEVTAARASFVCDSRRVAFSLGQVAGARLYRGRELIGSRVAWAGFGYSFPAALGTMAYELCIERLPEDGPAPASASPAAAATP